MTYMTSSDRGWNGGRVQCTLAPISEVEIVGAPPKGVSTERHARTAWVVMRSSSDAPVVTVTNLLIGSFVGSLTARAAAGSGRMALSGRACGLRGSRRDPAFLLGAIGP